MSAFIDRTALSILSTIGFYLFFLNAWDSIPLACSAAFVCAALSRWLLGGLPLNRHVTAAQARSELMRIAELDDLAAEEALRALLQHGWPGERFRLAPVLKHPEATLSSGDVLNAWKTNRDAGRLVIATTCPCEPRAAYFARELHDPAVAVVDSRRLNRLLRTFPADTLPCPPRRRLGDGFRMLWAGMSSTRFSPKSVLLALTMVACYMLTGNAWYLFPGLAVAAHAGIALIRHGSGKQLFEGDSVR